MDVKGVVLEDYAIRRGALGGYCQALGCFEQGAAQVDGYPLCPTHLAVAQAFVPEPAAGEPVQIDKTFAFHQPSLSASEKINCLREHFSSLQRTIEAECPASRHRAVALTELETSAMWAIKAVVFNDPTCEVA